MRDLSIRITAETDQAEASLKRVEKGLDNVGASASKTGEAAGLSLGTLTKAAGGYIAFQQAMESAVSLATGSLTAFSEQEQALKRLTIALRENGQTSPDVIAQYAALADAFERTTRFSDDAFTEVEALFALTGKIGPEMMKPALEATANLAVGLGKNLPEAAQMVIQALDGNVRALGRYLTETEKADIKTRGAAAALEAINAHFGGQALADLETYAGRVENVGNRWNNFQERVGDLIARTLTPLLDLFDAMPESLQNVTFGIGSMTAVFAPLAGAVALLANAFGVSLIPVLTGGLMAAWAGFSGLITGTILPMLTVALPVALKALAALFTVPAGLVVAGIAAVVAIWYKWDAIGPIVQRVYTAVKEWLVDKFGVLVNWIGEKVGMVTGFFKDMYEKVVGGSYVPDTITGIEVHFARLPSVMVSPTQSATDAVVTAFQRMGQIVVGSLQPMFSAMHQSISTAMPGLFGGTGLFSQIMQSGLMSLLGPGGIAATLVMKGLEALGNLAMKGLKKIGGWIRGLFGGASDDELAGRELVADFEQALEGMLSDAQRLEAGNEAWKATVIAIRDKYLALGLTEEEAMRDAERLWASSRDGAEAAKRVIEEIQRKFAGGIDVPVRVVTVGALPDVFDPRLTTPGIVDDLASDVVRNRLTSSDASVSGFRPDGITVAQPVLAGGSSLGTVNLYVNGYMDSRTSARRLATSVRQELDAELQRRRRMSAG